MATPAERKLLPGKLLPDSLSIDQFINPMQITKPAQFKKLIAANAYALTAISSIDTEKEAIRVINIVANLKSIISSERTRPLLEKLDEATRKQFDDIMIMVMTPEALPYRYYDAHGNEARLRKLALETLLQAQSVDGRMHNSRLCFSEVVLDVVPGLLRADHVSDQVKQGMVQALLDQPRVAEFTPHLAGILKDLDKTPPYTDYDGRPYPNHWARDALITLSDIARPDLTESRTGRSKPTSAPR